MRTFIIVILLFAAVKAEAVTRYVRNGAANGCSNGSTNYNPSTDTCSGATQSTVYTTIPNGIGATFAGDILEIRQGTYSGMVNENTTTFRSGTSFSGCIAGTAPSYTPTPSCATAPIIRARAGETVIISGMGFNGNFTYMIFQGITVDGTPQRGNDFDGIYIQTGGRLRFENMEIRNNDDHGIHVAGGVGNNEFINIRSHDNGLSPSGHCGVPVASTVECHGAYLQGGPSLVDGGEWYNHRWGNGIQVYPPNDNNTVKNAIFHNNHYDTAWSGGGRQETTIYGNNNVIFNNVFYGPGSSGDYYAMTVGYGSGTVVYSNTVYGFQGGLSFENNNTNVVVRNNLFYGSNYVIQSGATMTGSTISNNYCGSAQSGCITGTVNFVAPTATPPNLQLQTTSTGAIDRGFTLCTPPCTYSIDKSGVTRPSGTSWDIGAYEYQAGGGGGGSTITSVTWTNSRTGASGSADTFSPASTVNWSMTGANALDLLPGTNSITVTATDSNNVTGSSNIVVTYAPLFPGNAWVGGWAFDETATVGTCTYPTCALDSSVATPPNNGTLINGATRAAGQFGTALSLNGVDQYVIVPNATSLNFTQSFTYAAWVRATAQMNDYRAIFNRDVSGWTVNGLFGSVTGFCGDGGIVALMEIDGPGTPQYWVCDPTPLVAGAWTFLAMTYDGPGPGSSLKLYRNGVLVPNGSIPVSGYMQPPTTGNNSLGIGATPAGSWAFNGMIDEARIANYAVPYNTTKNSTPNTACDYSDTDANGRLNASIVGWQNCRIISPTPPLLVKFPAAATGLQVQPGTTLKVGQP